MECICKFYSKLNVNNKACQGKSKINKCITVYKTPVIRIINFSKAQVSKETSLF